jgi:hypothetical protein
MQINTKFVIMPVTTKHKRIVKNKKVSATVDNSVGNYEKHPFFVKKAKAAKAVLDEVGLPKKSSKTK